jgi:hypothetical protein
MLTKKVVLHLTYYPQDPSSTVIQKIFCNRLVLKPTGEPTLPQLHSFKGYLLEMNRMVVTYSHALQPQKPSPPLPS